MEGGRCIQSPRGCRVSRAVPRRVIEVRPAVRARAGGPWRAPRRESRLRACGRCSRVESSPCSPTRTARRRSPAGSPFWKGPPTFCSCSLSSTNTRASGYTGACRTRTAASAGSGFRFARPSNRALSHGTSKGRMNSDLVAPTYLSTKYQFYRVGPAPCMLSLYLIVLGTTRAHRSNRSPELGGEPRRARPAGNGDTPAELRSVACG